MATALQISLSEEAKRKLERFDQLPAEVLRAACRAIDKENQLTIGYIQEHKLSERGPDTLGVVTNRLRSSPWATKAEVLADGVQGGAGVQSTLGTNVIYAGVHEFGIDKDVTVKEHVRKTATRFSIDNGRRTVSRSAAARLGLLTKAGKGRKGMAQEVGGKDVTVKAHMRHMKMPARAMFRKGIQERGPNYATALSKAILEGFPE